MIVAQVEQQIALLRAELLDAIIPLLPTEQVYVDIHLGCVGRFCAAGIKYMNGAGLHCYEARRDQTDLNEVDDLPVEFLVKLYNELKQRSKHAGRA